MQRWEYKLIEGSEVSDTDLLKNLGAKGWEICAAMSSPDIVYLKRPLEER